MIDQRVLDVLSTIPQQTRHTVTAIIVAHDGARLLPGLVQALEAQTQVGHERNRANRGRLAPTRWDAGPAAD